MLTLHSFKALLLDIDLFSSVYKTEKKFVYIQNRGNTIVLKPMVPLVSPQ